VNPVVLFLIQILLLSLLVVGVWWWVLRRDTAPEHDDAPDQSRSNVQVYRDQLSDLERDWNQGVLSESEYRSTRDELTRRLLEDTDAAGQAAQGHAGARAAGVVDSQRRQRRWLAIGLALYLPLASLGLYGWLGQPLALDPVALSQGEPDHAIDPAKLSEMVAKLEQRLQDEPQQVDGWVMLARVQRARDRLEEADKAYARALALSANDDIAIERAEVLARLRGGFEGEPWQIIERVIRVDPEHVNARLLAGSAAYAEGRYDVALQHWMKVQGRLPAGSPEAPALEEAIQQARAKLGPSVSAQMAGSATTGAASASGGVSRPQSAGSARIAGRVSLAPSLVSRVAPTDTVFIYATPTQGSRMPLAIARVTVSQLPYSFVLDESSAMNPQATLAGQQEVTVRARISSTGDAMPKPGELGVLKTPVKVGAQGLELRIEGPLN
jgi:cytochrome c-type biogenesis protein CcmH